MKIESVNRYYCSLCGAEYDDDERWKCEEHEKSCRKSMLRDAYNIKRICERLHQDKDLSCYDCPFYYNNNKPASCLFGNTTPREWKIRLD